jgi:hypothetical protein
MHDANEKDELDPGKPLAMAASPSRKRKKLADGGTESVRRLRRSHEACARCRLKKIKASIIFCEIIWAILGESHINSCRFPSHSC